MNRSFGPRQILILLILSAIALSPRPIAGLLDLNAARRSEANGDHAGAAAGFVQAARRLPWQPSLWEQAGSSALAGGDGGDAIQYFKLLALNGRLSREGWVRLGDAYQQAGDAAEAIRAWSRALDDFGPSADVYGRLAQAHRRAGQYSLAIEEWRSALALEPDDPQAHYQIGLLLAAGQPEEALPELTRAGQLDPALAPNAQGLRTAINTALLSDQPAYRFLVTGQALAALSEWDLADVAFQNAVASDARYAEAWAWLAEARQQGGLDAQAEIQRALTLNPDSAMVQGLYGLYLQRQGQLQEARIAFLKAAARQPADAGWQLALGALSEQAGDLIAARAYLMSAVELAPDSLPAWRALASFCLRNSVELTTTGLAAARRLVQLAPDDWQSQDLAGQILLETGDVAGAEAILKKAIQLDPTQAAPALHLALLYLQTGNRLGAYSYLNQARAFDPDGPYGGQAARLLEQYFP